MYTRAYLWSSRRFSDLLFVPVHVSSDGVLHDGQEVVRLPLSSPVTSLGAALKHALSSFHRVVQTSEQLASAFSFETYATFQQSGAATMDDLYESYRVVVAERRSKALHLLPAIFSAEIIVPPVQLPFVPKDAELGAAILGIYARIFADTPVA